VDISSVVIAAVSVIGTLSGAIVTSLIADRSKRQDFDRQRAEREERLRHEDSREFLLDRRRCYVALNVTCREYIGTLRAWAHTLAASESYGGADIAGVKDARLAFRSAYAEMQLIAPESVLTHGSLVSADLADAYGMLMRIKEGTEISGDAAHAILALMDAVWTPLRKTREEMRTDLKVGTPAD
jgi:hypothetical protein